VNGPLRRLAVVAFALFASLLASTTWIQFVSSGDLRGDGRNSRTLLEELGRERGPILVGDTAVATSVPVDDRFQFQRTYDEGERYAHATGFYSVSFGASGIEEAASDLLTGTSDEQFYRRISDLLTGTEPQGAAITLTLDPQAQAAAADALGDQRGAVVALDPGTGAILAMVSSPTFDPDEMATHDIDAANAARQALLEDPADPLVNRAIAGNLYPPGSVFKIVTAAAALEDGGLDEDSVLPGPAVLDLPQTDADLPNSSGSACGSGDQVSLTNALRISCNTTFGYLGMELGGDVLAAQAEAFGFDQRLRVPLRVTPSSVPAELTPPQEAQAAIGQFDVRVTPLQVAMVSAAVANGGDLMRPSLVAEVRAPDLDLIDRLTPQSMGRAVSGDTAEALTRMMVEVVEDGTGTAARISGIDVAGKTGTAQHATDRSPHAWFTAFAPADDPQVAVAVVVEEGGSAGDEASGGRTAAPIARDVIEAVVSR